MVATRINLLATDLRPELELRPELLSAGLVVIFLLVATLISTMNHFAIQRGERELARIRADKKEIEAKVSELSARSEARVRRHARYTLAREVAGKKTYWVEMFNELTGLMPQAVWLTGFSTNASETEHGIVLKGEAGSQAKVAELLRALEKSAFFNRAIIKTSEKQESYSPELYKFEISVPSEKESNV